MTNETLPGPAWRLVTREFIVPFILVTSLFLLWGVAHSLLDVLNKHFQDILGITRARSGLVQAALYGGYFIMAIPAGLFMSRMGYRKGIITGLLLYAAGTFLFWPATFIQTFEFTLLALFVIACGLTFLETAANPYSSVLGPRETSEQRLTFSQSFNGLGWIIGPALGGMLILGGDDAGDTNKFSSMALVMLGLGWPSLIALYLNYFCMSIMFPTIFAPGLKDLGGMTKKGSPVLVMTIIGGAICPVIMGRTADVSGMAVGFAVPLVCFAFIAWYTSYRAKSIINLTKPDHSHV